MVHVLFDGNIRRHPALRSLLWQLGATVGDLSRCIPAGSRATVEDCDAVVHLAGGPAPTGFVSGAMPDGAETEGVAAAAAPLLVIGPGAEITDPWVNIPDPGPRGARLKTALQSCRRRAEMLRGDSHSHNDLDQFRNFVGHELRSPLTAIKTALTVLKEEESSDPGSARMLGIALRNLTRLAETVEWSQELRSLAEAPLAAELGPVTLAAVAAEIPDHLDLYLAGKHESQEVLTDPRLLGDLAVQMNRVLAYACPASRAVFRLELEPGSGDCRLAAEVVAEKKAGISCPGGLEAGHVAVEWDRVGFDNLVRMLISPDLLQALGVKPRIFVEARDAVMLTIDLPSCETAGSPVPDPLFLV